MAHVAFVVFRMFFVILRLGGIAFFHCHFPHLIEPFFLAVGVIVGGHVAFDDGRQVFRRDVFRSRVFIFEIVIEPEADEVEDLFRVDQVFSGLVPVSAHVQDLCQEGRIRVDQCGIFRVEFLRPIRQEGGQFLRRDPKQHVLADVIEFVQVEERTGIAHLFRGKSEFVDIRFRIFDPPFFEVGIQYGQQVFTNRSRVVAFFPVEIQGQFRVVALGELSLDAGVLVDLHQLCRMAVDRKGQTQCFKKFHVNRQRGQPFFPSDHVGGPHQVVIDHVCEVVGGDPVGFQDDHVLEVLRHSEFAPDRIRHGKGLSGILRTFGTKTDDVFLSGFDLRPDLFQGQIPMLRIFPVDPWGLLFGFLPGTDLVDLFGSQEAGVGLSFFDHILDECLVDLRPAALVIGAVIPGVFFDPGAFVKGYTEEVQGPDDQFRGAFHLPFIVRVFDPQEEGPVALVGQTFIHESSVEIPQVHEPRGTGPHTGDFSVLRQVSFREGRFPVCRFFSDSREQKFRQLFIVHIIPPMFRILKKPRKLRGL